jgi:hypothetical protein
MVCLRTIVLLLIPMSAIAADYEADLRIVADYEQLRPLIDGCTDLGELERLRSAIDRSTDLEELREALESVGVAQFTGCPAGVSASGVRRTDKRTS